MTISFRPATLAAALVLAAPAAFADPLPSWRSGETKAAIVDFVEAASDPESDGYITPDRRIATFDNDGALWRETPMYFQVIFAFDRIREMAEADPKLAENPAVKAALEGVFGALAADHYAGLLEVVGLSHSGMSVPEFQAESRKWLTTATHPETGRPYVEHVYQPMLELLSYLRDEGWATWIVSGGGVHFVRAFAEETYNIPPWQVVGSVGESVYAEEDGPRVMKAPGLAFLDDKAGKPVGIDRQIGAVPAMAVGNSDGDFEMLKYATSAEGPRLGVIVHHTDAERESAYDRDSHVGRLDKALDAAPERGWVVIDMAQDWRVVHPFELD